MSFLSLNQNFFCMIRHVMGFSQTGYSTFKNWNHIFWIIAHFE